MQRTQEGLEGDVQELERGEGRMELMQIPINSQKVKGLKFKSKSSAN